MKRKLLSLIALLAVGGTLAAWGYAQDSGPAEPARFQPAQGSLSGQLQSASAAVAKEHGAKQDGQVQQTAGLDWLLNRNPSRNKQSTPATPNQQQPKQAAPNTTTQAKPAAPVTPRGPAPVTIDREAAKSYGNLSAPASTARGTTTTQFRPVNSRLQAPATRAEAPAAPSVASRPLNAPPAEAPVEESTQPEAVQLEAPAAPMPAPTPLAAPSALAAPQPIKKPAVEISAPSFSDRSLAAPSISAKGTATIIESAAPALGLSVSGPQAIVVGRESEFVVKLQNMGTTDARNLMVNLVLPNHVTLVATDARSGLARLADDSTSAVAWQINSLASGGIAELSLQLVATQARPVNFDLNYFAAPSVATASVEVQQPKLEISLNGPNEISYGETRNYTLSISNPGTGDAENVILQLQPLSRNLEAGVTRELGTLLAGERKAIEVELTAEEAGQLAVRAAVSATGGLQAQTQLTVHVRRAELAIEAIGPPQKFAGSEAIYQVKLSNLGDATATGVALAAILPEGAEALDATEGAANEDGSLGWNVGSLAPGDARIFRVICSLGKAGQNVVDLRAKCDGGLTAAGSVRTQVEAIADLNLTVNDPKGPIAVGRDATYEIRVVNRGSKAAENISVKGYFSEGIEPVTIDGAIGKAEVGQAIFEPIARIEAGEELVLKITARASAGGNHIFRAVVECPMPETRLVTEETTRYFETTAAGFGDTLQR